VGKNCSVGIADILQWMMPCAHTYLSVLLLLAVPFRVTFSLALRTGIVGIQLAITTAVCGMFMFQADLKGYLNTHPWPIWTSMIGSMVTLLAMVCNPQITRSFPMNYGLLGVFTFFQSVMVGFICMVCSLLLCSTLRCIPAEHCMSSV
jgi:hypothetical protein